MILEPTYKIDKHDMMETVTEDGDGFRLGHIQDCTGVLERNKRIRDDYAANKRFGADVVVEASIPAIIFEKIMDDNNMKWPLNPDQLDYVLKLIENDPSLKYFRMK